MAALRQLDVGSATPPLARLALPTEFGARSRNVLTLRSTSRPMPPADADPIEPRAVQPRGRPRRGMYLLPSLFTLGNIFLGFRAVVAGHRGDFQLAALLIFAAAVLDALDGRIARLTGTESDFGREFDSLADVLTFGSAPALLTYFWGLADLGRVGWLVPLFFLVCTATRLARFNVQTKVVDSRFFVGLPSPVAAAAIGSLLFVIPHRALPRSWETVSVIAALILVGSLMVSTFRYPSFKKVDLRQRQSYRLLLPITTILLVVAYHPPAFFLSVALVYTAYGPLSWLVGRVGRGTRDAEVAPYP